MTNIVRLLLISFSLALCGCAATVTNSSNSVDAPLKTSAKPTSVTLFITASPEIQASKDWHTFRAEWRSAFDAAASAASIRAVYVEAAPADSSTSTVLIRVSVNDYRYLTSGSRYGFGVLTGNAFIDAEAEFIEYPMQRSLGKRKYGTTSSAWQGVFSAMTDKQVRAISDAMLQEVASR